MLQTFSSFFLFLGACFFCSLLFLLYGTVTEKEVQEEIVGHVVENWEEFSMSQNSNGDNYPTSFDYNTNMSKPHTYSNSLKFIQIFWHLNLRCCRIDDVTNRKKGVVDIDAHAFVETADVKA